MSQHPRVREFAGAITVCDLDGAILEMNDKALRAFQEQGGSDVVTFQTPL